jgi:hypothetical protein
MVFHTPQSFWWTVTRDCTPCFSAINQGLVRGRTRFRRAGNSLALVGRVQLVGRGCVPALVVPAKTMSRTITTAGRSLHWLMRRKKSPGAHRSMERTTDRKIGGDATPPYRYERDEK